MVLHMVNMYDNQSQSDSERRPSTDDLTATQPGSLGIQTLWRSSVISFGAVRFLMASPVAPSNR